ncbi:MAG: response regulator [Candidatus Saliniplasma sp.]
MKILFVDDDQGLLDQAKYVLEKENQDFEVIPVESSDDALNFLEENDVDIIVSDYKMPGMDGLDLLKTLRAQGNEIPFIIFTGKGREEIAMKALNLGADRYFKKGGDPIAQYEVLGKAIEQETYHRRTEKKHAELISGLEKLETKYMTLFENIRLPLTVLDDEGNILLANTSFENLSNYSRDELEGKKGWFQFVADEHEDKVKKLHDLRGIDEELSQKGYRFDFVDKYGTATDLYASLTKIPSSSETLVSLFDISELKPVVDELKDFEQVILDSEFEEIKDYIRSISNELFVEDSLKSSVKDWCLEEILLLLIRIKEGSTGKDLMSFLNDLFVMDLSSSTVYPKLHDLEDQGVLKVQEHIRTKEYIVEDYKKAEEIVKDKIMQLYGIFTILRLLNSISEG